MMKNIPSYLSNFAAEWAVDPHAANLSWWKQANYGLFIHYGLYSQLGRGEWVMWKESIPLSQYEKMFDSFNPCNFDADFITDLALEAGMQYVTMVTCHHEGYCLWDSKVEPYNSINSAARRDLVGEMAQQCAKKGLGFFTYYTYMINWRHPFFLTRDYLTYARPDYPSPEPRYRFRQIEDFQKYLAYMENHLSELLSGYGPLAGMWLDIIMAYYALPDIVPVDRTYDLIRGLQPQALICYKQGATGDEDFATPEQHFHSLEERASAQFGPRAGLLAKTAWEKNIHKHNEICATLQKGAWGYQADAQHLSGDELWALLGHARGHNCNLLANVGPLPDGSIHPDDIRSLKEVGRRIRGEGWPSA